MLFIINKILIFYVVFYIILFVGLSWSCIFLFDIKMFGNKR